MEALGSILQAIGWAFLPFVILPVFCLFLPQIWLTKQATPAIIRTIDAANHGLGEIAKWSLPLLVLSVAVSVFALSIFGITTTALLESASYIQAIVIMLGAAATLLAGQHVRVDIFHSAMNAKAKARVDLIGFYILLLPTCLLILWNSQSFVSFAWNIFEGSSESDGIQGVFLLKTLIPIFAITMIAQGLSIALRAALVLAGQPEPICPKYVSPLFDDNENLEAGL